MRILFVCTGNTCRSPMAQELAKSYFPEGTEVLSAGIHALEGAKVSENAVLVMKEKGRDISQHRAVSLTREMMASSGQIITMTKDQKDFLTAIYPEFKDKIRCLGHVAGEERDITDPWGHSLEVYRQCAQQMEKLLDYII